MAFDIASLCAVLSLIALVFLPGGALIALFRTRDDDIGVKFGIMAGAGLAAQPLAALWARLVGLPMREITLWGVLAACAAVIVWRWRAEAGKTARLAAHNDSAPVAARSADLDSSNDSTNDSDGNSDPNSLRDSDPSADLDSLNDPNRDPRRASDPALERSAIHALVGILAVLLAARWAVAHELSVPLWGDSVHHSMIVRLFTLHEGLPSDWLPFEPLAPFTYHFGLHALTAGVALLSGIPEHRALIVTGQSLMVLQSLTAYALVAGLTGRRWAGVGAAIVAGGLGPMPGQYLNWGRYTQLAGQAILPVAALRLARAGRGQDGRGGVAIAALLAAGLALTHYLVAVFFAVFGVAWLALGDGRLGQSTTTSRQSDSSWMRDRAWRLARLALVAMAAVLLASPWIPQFLAGRLDEHAAALLTTELPDPGVWGAVEPAWIWSQVGDFVGFGLVAASILAATWAIARRERVALLGLAWTTILIAATYPSLFGVPITGVLKDFAVLIGLYVPLGLLIGPAFAVGVERLNRMAAERSRARVATAVAVALVAALHVAGPTRTEIDPASVYASSADERAFAWIAENTPADAVFLVSAAPAYAGTVVAGDDGGWWIPQLAGRKTTLPPITYGLEPSMEPGYREAVNALNAAWREDIDGAASEEALRAAGVGWAYTGPRDGTLSAERLIDSPSWEVVYEGDGATVFKAAWAEESVR